jgi:hypothetical protein
MKTKLKSWLVIALVFVVGFAAGVVATRGVVRNFVQQTVNNPDHVRELIERRLTRRLDLDASQQEKVHTILIESQGEMRTLRGEFRPRFMTIVTNTEERVSAVLTDEQRVRYDEVRAEARQFIAPQADLGRSK